MLREFAAIVGTRMIPAAYTRIRISLVLTKLVFGKPTNKNVSRPDGANECEGASNDTRRQ